jgi:hypothetical protein
MEAHDNIWHPHYHEVISPENNDNMPMHRMTPESVTGRPSSIDPLCMLDDGTFSLHIEQRYPYSPLNPVIGDRPQDGSLEDDTIVASASTARHTNSIGYTSLEARASLGRKPYFQPHGPVLVAWQARYFKDRWLWEMISMMFSVACIIAVVILASRLHRTLLSNWTFLLQPSTLISLLVTAAQSSMMLVVAEVISQLKWIHMSLPRAQPLADLNIFDSASRGPLGSLSLIYRWRPPMIMMCSLVYTASMITVTALAMGPFAQQIVSIQDISEPQENVNSTIAVSNHYNTNNTASGLEMQLSPAGNILFSVTSDGAFDVEPEIQGAFYNGIYNSGGSFINFGCPSGNCSWSTFTSLGICSACQDVSSSSKIESDGVLGGTSHIHTPGGWNVSFDQHWTVAALTNSSLNFATLGALSAGLISLVVVQLSHNYHVTECSIAWCAKQYNNITVVKKHIPLHPDLSSGLQLIYHIYRPMVYSRIST